MPEALVCWKCGESLAELLLPLGRRAQCPGCRADLHVCRMCEFYDPRVSRSCREPVAEDVQDKERANFCGYFEPRPNACSPSDENEARRARSELEALFGEESQGEAQKVESDAAREALEDLFGSGSKEDKH